jgi:hypothetical protein
MGLLDVDGDGNEEILLSSPGQQEDGNNMGEVISYSYDEEVGIFDTGSILSFDVSNLGINQFLARSAKNLALRMSTESDFDGDGYLDFAFVNSIRLGGSLTIYRADSDGLQDTPHCVVSIPRFGRTTDPYQGRLLGGWDLNQDGKDDYVLGSQLFHSEHGGIYILYGRDTEDCSFDVEFKGWRNGGRLGSDFTLGLIDDDVCPDLVVSEPTLHTDKTGTGVIHILWGTGDGCRPQAEFTSLYHALELNYIGTNLVSGMDLNDDGYDDIVYSQGLENHQFSFMLDGMALAQAPSTPFFNNMTPEGPLYPEPWSFYDQLSDYLMGDTIFQGDATMALGEDSNGTKWLAFGKYKENIVELYRFDENEGVFESIPYVRVGANSNKTNWKGDFGIGVQFHGDKVLVSAPESNIIGLSIGAVQMFSLPD